MLKVPFDWREEGFAAPPFRAFAFGNEKLYRAWGGDPKRKWGNTDRAGVCFSLDQALTRREAERMYAVMEYGNPVRFITQFALQAGTPFWSGIVDPGLLGGRSATQAYVERAHLPPAWGVKEVADRPLKDDLGPFFIYAGRMPRRGS